MNIRAYLAAVALRSLRNSMLFALACGAASPSLYAADLGNIGRVYPVQEQSLLEFIAHRLKAMESSGEMGRLQREHADRQIAAIRNPAPIPGLVTRATRSTHYIDPSVVLERDLLDQNGRLLFVKGTVKNPLDVIGFSRKLLFLDARDARQVAYAQKIVQQYGAAIKPVLVGGSYLDLMKRWKTRVFYDQQGYLVRRFHITQVPALVYQENKMLRVDQMETAP